MLPRLSLAVGAQPLYVWGARVLFRHRPRYVGRARPVPRLTKMGKGGHDGFKNGSLGTQMCMVAAGLYLLVHIASFGGLVSLLLPLSLVRTDGRTSRSQLSARPRLAQSPAPARH